MRACVFYFLFTSLFFSLNAFAIDEFEINEIRFEGLQRISNSTVVNYLPLKQGDKLTERTSADAIRALFKTGFFSDIRVSRAGSNVLVFQFTERPSIAKVEIKGNEDITSDDLNKALKKIGLAEGRIFNRSILEKVEQELERQYFAQGKYGVSIKSSIEELERNRVAVNIKINEGDVARIRYINIIGNKAFANTELLKRFKSAAHDDYTAVTGDSKYSKEKLYADLEEIRSFYLDRGYINFSIDSTQVTITPDKKDVFVTVNITEGKKYFVKSVDMAGDLIVDPGEVRKLINIKDGDVFSRKSISESSNQISERLGVEGYAFANVNASPTVDEEKSTVALTFYVDPGKRVYVRRVIFAGNTKTQDEVLRREMRQLEGGWISTSSLQRSRIRLQRTGFFDEVNIETPSVPGYTDMMDVVVNVVERPSGSVQASVGYGGSQGIIIAGSVQQNNFLGTGKRVGLEVNRSEVSSVYNFSVNDPYYTIDGISRNVNVFMRETRAAAVTNVGNYFTNAYGTSVAFGFPLSEFRSARYGVGYENTDLRTNSDTPKEYLDFEQRNGSRFDTFTLTSSFSYDSRNKTLFADSGSQAVLSADVAVPTGGALDRAGIRGLTYYKVNYRQQFYIPLINDWTIHLEGLLSYGDGYGDLNELPFFENFYAGGGQSVRGFRENSLGPKSTPRQIIGSNGAPLVVNGVNAMSTPVALGGDRRATGTAEVVFPLPIAEESKNTRLSAFLDAGNVWGRLDTGEQQAISWRDLRASYGASFIWITPVGALRFSWAWPLRTKTGDELETFQFSIGAPF